MAQAPAAPETELLTRAQSSAGRRGRAYRGVVHQRALRRVPTEGDTRYRLGNLYANNNKRPDRAAAYNRGVSWPTT